jgi:hypothetical protein
MWPMPVVSNASNAQLRLPKSTILCSHFVVAVVENPVIQTKFFKMTCFSTILNPKVKNHYIIYRSLLPEQYDPTFKFLTAELAEL